MVNAKLEIECKDPRKRCSQNKLQKLEDALLKHILTAADLADIGDIDDRGDMGDRGALHDMVDMGDRVT